MSLLLDKDKCTGCTACFAVCPRDAISMSVDLEGFLYPNINESLCIKCGLCKKVCPSLNQNSACMPIVVYAAKAKDDAIRDQSSSGGMFSLLARETFKAGGLVWGAAFNHDDWHVYHRVVDNDNELSELRGAKYVQSAMGNVFKEIKIALSQGREVLFSGTPCQIAGLRNYLGMFQSLITDKLLLVEVVCHAVPSPLVWRKYLEKRVVETYDKSVKNLRSIRRISLRCKRYGWKRYSFLLGFDNNKEYLKAYYDDTFMRGFLAELFNRPSCHECPCKNLKSGADLTIADYWGVRSKFIDMDDDKGTSLILVNTKKGLDLLLKIEDLIVLQSSDFEHACKSNPAIVVSTKPHCNRNRFFRKVHCSDFDNLVNLLLRPPFKQRIKARLVWVLRRLGLVK